MPAPIRMDIALTSFARAVLLHDDATADRLARTLGGLMPAMAADFASIGLARPGPDKLFAQTMIFAKIPGLRADLLDYTRPAGAVAGYEGVWPNWVMLARPDPDAIAPGPGLYDNADYQVRDVPAGTDLGGGHRRLPDPVCDGMCGAGGFVPRQPAFLAGTAARATAERRFLPPPGKYGDTGTIPGARAEAFPSETKPAKGSRRCLPRRAPPICGIRRAGLCRTAPAGPTGARGTALADPHRPLRAGPQPFRPPGLRPAEGPLSRQQLGEAEPVLL